MTPTPLSHETGIWGVIAKVRGLLYPAGAQRRCTAPDCLNAVAAMSRVVLDHSRLVFKTEVWEDRGERVSVRDFGPGIDEDHKDRLFEPFYTTRPKGQEWVSPSAVT